MAALKVSRISRKGILNTLRGKTFMRPFWPGRMPSYEELLTPKKFEKIPAAEPLPLVGNLWRYYLGKEPFDSMLLTYEGYLNELGPLVKEHFFLGRTRVHVFDPMDMKRIYNEDQRHTPTRISHRFLQKYRRDRYSRYNTGGLASSNGEEWEMLRALLEEEELLTEYSNAAFENITKDLISAIYRLTSFKQKKEYPVLPLLYNWSMECLGAVLIGQRFDTRDNIDSYDPMIEQFIEYMYLSQKAVFYTENLPKFLTGKYYQQLITTQDSIYRYLKRHIQETTHRYYLGEIKLDKLPQHGGPITFHRSLAFNLAVKRIHDDEINTFIIDLFQGGMYPLAHTLAFAMYYLATHPEIQKTIRASLVEKFPSLPESNISSKPVSEDIKNVIRETMRLNPPLVGTVRVLPVSLVLSGYRVPKGTMCILHHQIASKQEKYFSNPDEFIPDRFNEDLSPESLVANSPFSMGRRACPGKDIAMEALGISLSKLLRHFELDYKYEKVGMRNRLVNEPDREIKISFITARK